MRPLNANEQRLLALFLGAMFIIATLVGFSFFKKLNASSARQLADLKNQKFEASFWIDEHDLWLQRRVWLDEKQPVQPSGGAANSALLEYLQKSAAARNITILDQSLPEPTDSPYFREVSVKLRVNGKLDSLTPWLAEIQAPDLFQAITSFNIRSDKEPPAVICDLQIARWYAPK